MRSSLSLIILVSILPAAHAHADAVSDLLDLPGSKWRAEQPIKDRMVAHTEAADLRLTVHYTDIGKNFSRPLKDKLKILYNYSTTKIEGPKKRLWGDIPYHYFIDAHGKIGEARAPNLQPDSNTYYKRDGHITIVIEGNEADGVNAEQKAKLFSLLQALQEKYKIPMERVGTHKDFAQTDCPGTAISALVKLYKTGKHLK